MRCLSIVLAALVALSLRAERAASQEQRAFPSWSPEEATALRATSHTRAVADSVRQKVGYRHWEGAAIGAGAGAVIGLLLGLAGRYACSDCSGDPSIAATSLMSAGAVGAFGFLVGLASPKYRWVADSSAHEP